MVLLFGIVEALVFVRIMYSLFNINKNLDLKIFYYLVKLFIYYIMSEPYIRLKLFEGRDAETYTADILNKNGWGMMSQIQRLNKTEFGITGVQTLIEPADYGFYVYLINKTDQFLDYLNENEELLQKYDEIQVEGRLFKSYMIDKLDPKRKYLNRDNDEIYMICVAMIDITTLNSCNVLFLCSDLLEALNKIHYGVEDGSRYNFRDRKKGGKKYNLNTKKKRHKRSYKKKKQKTRRYKK